MESKRQPLFASPWITFILILAIIAIYSVKMIIVWRESVPPEQAERHRLGQRQAAGIVEAIEQYSLDFPEAGMPSNTAEWIKQLAGHNAKGIQYLPLNRFTTSRDGRLLDPCGKPFSIVPFGSPDFQPEHPESAQTEFNVRGCFTFDDGHLGWPRFERN